MRKNFRGTNHSRTHSPFFARLAARGSGEIQIVEASDWLQEILLTVLIPDLSGVNNIPFTYCIVFVTIFFNMRS